MRWLLVRWANNKAQNGRKCWHPIDFSFLLGSDLLLCIRKLVECDCPKKKGEGRCYTNCTYPFNFQLKLTGAPPKEIKIITRPLYSNGLRDRSITPSQGVHVFVNVYISPIGRLFRTNSIWHSTRWRSRVLLVNVRARIRILPWERIQMEANPFFVVVDTVIY